MNRYKIRRESYPNVKLFLKGKLFKKDVPTYARKFKDDLTFKNKNLYYKGHIVIPQEDVDTYLRKEFYNKESDVPLSRDGAWHILKKRDILGITRARLMKFLQSQSAVESVRNAPRKPKQKGGKPVKKFHFETDLVFIRKPDFTKISSKFDETIPKKETYIVSTCEVLTGLCRLDYIQQKSETMPILKKHLKSMAKELGIKDLKKYSGSSDKGEVKIKEIQKMLPWKFVKMGSSIEKSNQTIQKTMFKLARMRRGYSIPDLLKQTEKITNNKFNSVHNKTPGELAEEAKDNEKEPQIVKQYNRKRKKHVPTVDTKLKVGDYVRILLLTHGKDKSVAFKSYKGLTFTKRVYKITHTTKNAIPPKFRVNKKWFLADGLLRTEKVDEISEKLIKDREDAQMAQDEMEHKAHMLKRQLQVVKQIAAAKKAEEEADALRAKTGRRTSRRAGAAAGRAKKLKAEAEGRAFDKWLNR